MNKNAFNKIKQKYNDIIKALEDEQEATPYYDDDIGSVLLHLNNADVYIHMIEERFEDRETIAVNALKDIIDESKIVTIKEIAMNAIAEIELAD